MSKDRCDKCGTEDPNQPLFGCNYCDAFACEGCSVALDDGTIMCSTCIDYYADVDMEGRE